MKGEATMDVRGKNVYLSGPMTGLDKYNVEAFASVHATLKEMGVGYVFNPALRYLVTGANKLAEMGHEDFMADTIHELTAREKRSQVWSWKMPMKYDLVLMLDGWRDSEGARMEKRVAEACGIEVCEFSEVLRG